ncbi:hypothetical protein M409DRAFT_19628 [Zasmidium cellare ATCC 36951]|uniref:Uncharacterized protein n=1 Tax=Zasmidium cellare ATCC 36951 TaxID=1080233 RepID=A0A6A6CSG2_ZASCE|nr:uncharacterized protein M409DRAFT_19628 [Zasmidium cellare ATCC 36951]KAF2170015.1 hypothetical protein M409DRAFT_19628 [Zasmidium cellare ATCC 36951]
MTIRTPLPARQRPQRRHLRTLLAQHPGSFIALAIWILLLFITIILLDTPSLNPTKTYDCPTIIEGHSPTRYTCKAWTWFVIFLVATSMGGLVNFVIQHGIVDAETSSFRTKQFCVALRPVLVVAVAWVFFGGIAWDHGCLRGCV